MRLTCWNQSADQSQQPSVRAGPRRAGDSGVLDDRGEGVTDALPQDDRRQGPLGDELPPQAPILQRSYLHSIAPAGGFGRSAANRDGNCPPCRLDVWSFIAARVDGRLDRHPDCPARESNYERILFRYCPLRQAGISADERRTRQRQWSPTRRPARQSMAVTSPRSHHAHRGRRAGRAAGR
jgi:hypothetical protein